MHHPWCRLPNAPITEGGGKTCPVSSENEKHFVGWTRAPKRPLPSLALALALALVAAHLSLLSARPLIRPSAAQTSNHLLLPCDNHPQ